MLRKFLGCGLAAIAILVSTASTAWAVPLNKSFSGEFSLDTPLGGTTSAARPELAGTVLEDVVLPFVLGSTTGTVQSRVVREDVSGTLDFYWRVKVDPTSPNGLVESFRLSDFGYSHINDADWRVDGLGSAAPFIGRVFNPANRPDGAMNFVFTDPPVGAGPLDEGTSGSRFFFLKTTATEYAKIANYDLTQPSGPISVTYPTFAPVPEPSTWVLLSLATAGVSLMARRRS